MKTAARKPANKSHSATVTRSGSFFKASGSSGFFAPVMRKARALPVVQTAGLSVSKPGDPLEKAADRTADAVLRMPAEQVQRAASPDQVQRATSADQVQRTASPDQVQRAASPEQVQRSGTGTTTVAADAKSEIQHAATGGQTLAPEVRSFMEPRLGADLSGVRVHADETAHSLSNHLSARAFTYGNHVFFGRDQYQPGTDAGRHLIAHELTHTIQQGATVQRAAVPEIQRAEQPEVQSTAIPEVQRAEQPPVQRAAAPEVARMPQVGASGSAPMVQRMSLGEQEALDYFANAANNIMGFRMLTLVLGVNPINQRRAERTPANLLRALIELVPGGAQLTRVLDTHGVIDKAAAWIEEQLTTLGDIGGQLVQSIKDFVSGLGLSDAFRFGSLWEQAKALITKPINQLISFGTSAVGHLLDLVRDAILKPLAALAQPTPGYDLLKAILGKDPISGEDYKPTAENLIGGFMKLIRQEDIWLNLKRGNAVARAHAWFKGALSDLMAFVNAIPAKIVQAVKSLTVEDVVTVAGAFGKVGGAFADAAAQFGSWAGRQVLTLLEILVSVVAPGVMPYIAKAKAAFATIVNDPVRFVGNLVRAGRLGFEKFADNILEHLKTALIKWLVGPLAQAGVYIPKAFTPLEIVKLVLSVLGLTWQNIRTKLVKIIPDPVLEALEKTAKVLVTLVTEGPAAAWEEIKTELSELKDQLIGQVTSMIQMEVVKAAVKKLVMMINPAGAVVQAISAIWTTVTFFIEKAQQIGAVVASFIDSIAAIASGQVENAAKRVEKTMADTLVVVIGFLANFAGLGGIPAKLVGIVKKIRAPIDKGLDKIVAWLGKMLKSLVGKAKDAAKKLLQWWKKKVPVKGAGEPHTLTFRGEQKSAKLLVQSSPQSPANFLREIGNRHKVPAKEQTAPITTTESHVKEIEKSQSILVEIDENRNRAATGTRKKAAEEASAKLDANLSKLATHFEKTFTETWKKWKVVDEIVKDISLPREVIRLKDNKPVLDDKGQPKMKKNVDWTPTAKKETAKDYRDNKAQYQQAGHWREKMFDASGSFDKKYRGRFDRRHIVSLRSIGKHYEETLNGKKISQAKLLLEQRSSIELARVEVKRDQDATVTSNEIQNAARERWRKFFNYANNIFIGPSPENNALKQRLDSNSPLMTKPMLNDHLARITREWAFDGSFSPERVQEE